MDEVKIVEDNLGYLKKKFTWSILEHFVLNIPYKNFAWK